jgi:hypothetical protein
MERSSNSLRTDISTPLSRMLHLRFLALYFLRTYFGLASIRWKPSTGDGFQQGFDKNYYMLVEARE